MGAVVLVLVALIGFLITRSGASSSSARTAAGPPAQAPQEPSPSNLTASTPAPSALATGDTGVAPTQAVGRGQPDCNGPCQIERRLTRAFLPDYPGDQTLLLASSNNPDEDGNLLHAFLVDGSGRVLWEEHGFGFQFLPVDDKFGVRFDESGHVFFRAFAADTTCLYVLYVDDGNPRLVGPPGRQGTPCFGEGLVEERPGAPSFAVTETLIECPLDYDGPYSDCPTRDVIYEWRDDRYVET